MKSKKKLFHNNEILMPGFVGIELESPFRGNPLSRHNLAQFTRGCPLEPFSAGPTAGCAWRLVSVNRRPDRVGLTVIQHWRKIKSDEMFAGGHRRDALMIEPKKGLMHPNV